MNRGRQLGDGRTTAIPQARKRQRSLSLDSLARGSYVPRPRGSSSLERKGSAIKQPFRASENSPSKRFANIQAQTRVISFAGGSSSAWGSSLSKKGSLKEHRPLSDKAYQKDCINKLLAYLEQKGYPHRISKSSLILPTKKDFETLFQFLYKFFDPKYEVVKIEDEVPKIMKSLGYPFTVTRSALISITHLSWPSLLGVIMWLLDVNKCVSSISVEKYFDSPDLEDADEQAIFLNYISGTYESGIVDPVKDKDVFQRLVRKKHRISSTSTIELMAKNDELEEMIKKELQEQAEFAELVERNKQIESDILNYQSHLENMKTHIKKKSVFYDMKKSKNAKKENQLKTLKAETSRLEALYKSQGYDGLHAQTFYQSKVVMLNHELTNKNKEKDAKEKELWDLEIKCSSLKYKAEKEMKELTHFWEQIRSKLENALPQALQNTQVPAAKKLCQEYNLKFPDIALNPFSNDLKPVLEFAEKYHQQRKSIQNIIVSQDRLIHQMRMKISEMDIQYKRLSAQAKTKESDAKEREHEMMQKVKEIDDKIKNIDKETLVVRRKRKDLEDCLAEKKALKEQLIKEVKLKEEELQLVELKGNEALESLRNEFRAARMELENEKGRVAEQMDALFNFINENPLPDID